MSHHPPARLARSTEFLELDCVPRLVFRALWVRGALRRWATDPDASAEDRVFRELEALGLLVGPGARRLFDDALSAWLRTGAMKREGRDLVLPILSGDAAREQPSAATLRKRRQRERDRQRASADPGLDPAGDIASMSQGDVTPGDGDPERDGHGDERRDSQRDRAHAFARPLLPERREEKKTLSSPLSGISEASVETQDADAAREAASGSRPDVTAPVTTGVTAPRLTEAEVFALIARHARGKIGTHPRALRGRFVERLAEEEVTREQFVVMMELAREGALFLQDSRPVIDLALLVGGRDGEAKVLGSWINATHREMQRRRDALAHEAHRAAAPASRAESPPTFHGPVKVREARTLARTANDHPPTRIEYLEQRRARLPGVAPGVSSAEEAEAAER